MNDEAVGAQDDVGGFDGSIAGEVGAFDGDDRGALEEGEGVDFLGGRHAGADLLGPSPCRRPAATVAAAQAVNGPPM